MGSGSKDEFEEKAYNGQSKLFDPHSKRILHQETRTRATA